MCPVCVTNCVPEAKFRILLFAFLLSQGYCRQIELSLLRAQIWLKWLQHFKGILRNFPASMHFYNLNNFLYLNICFYSQFLDNIPKKFGYLTKIPNFKLSETTPKTTSLTSGGTFLCPVPDSSFHNTARHLVWIPAKVLQIYDILLLHSSNL